MGAVNDGSCVWIDPVFPAVICAVIEKVLKKLKRTRKAQNSGGVCSNKYIPRPLAICGGTV